MREYSKTENYTLYHGSMLDMQEVIAAESIEAIVTDPPYELGFMGKSWDNSGIAFQKETWKKCLDVLKPGGYMLAFGGSRTFHRIACAIEDAGFEIRDTIMWVYSTGFPKSMNIGLAVYKKQASGEWKGWGTALKPSYEPVIVARKPCKGSCVDNVLEYGVGGINIDECRVATNDNISNHSRGSEAAISKGIYGNSSKQDTHKTEGQEYGRFPANLILTYDDSDFDEVCGGFPTGGKNGSISKPYDKNNNIFGEYGPCSEFTAYQDSGSAARYFYCAKASRKDRDEGLDALETKYLGMSNQAKAEQGRGNNEFNESTIGLNRVVARKCDHPCVKPTELMQYLVRLVTPNGGTILDPFNGSGSTGKAAMYENKERNKEYKYIGIELDEHYLEISKGRIDYVIKENAYECNTGMEGQISIFDLIGEVE